MSEAFFNKNLFLLGFLIFHGLSLAQNLCAQDITQLGGTMTTDIAPQKLAVQLPSPNISSQELFDIHLLGFGEFHKDFTYVKEAGKKVLGPLFNHNSCGGCHVENGKGKISFGPHASALLIKVSFPGELTDGSPKPVPHYGTQLRDHKVNGNEQVDIKLSWKFKKGYYPDSTPYTLRRPVLKLNLSAISSKQKNKVLTSLRMSPPMIGLGLLEAVPDSVIEGLSDPNDLNSDGISGHPNYVPDVKSNGIAIGRFGFKATHPTVEQQSAAAFFNDMGMTSNLFPDPKGKQQSEVSDDEMFKITFYLQAGGVPIARDQDDADVINGKALFQQINCSGCHVMTLSTEASSVVETAYQEFHPFSDLLLHDMGEDLADNRPEFSASGSEWRTTPLWGIGLSVDHVFNNLALGFMHDGRARTLEEAILWHGGEAQASRDAFMALSSSQRQQLIRFLESL